MKHVKRLIATATFGCVVAFGHTAAGQELVYSNAANDQMTRFAPGLLEVGDEITLGGTDRFLTEFRVQYFAVNPTDSFEGPVQARVRFHLNDGPLTPQEAPMPGTVFYDSGFHDIAQFGLTERSTLIYTDFVTGANEPFVSGLLPESFTWTVQFTGMAGGDNVGLDIYSPPTIGSTFEDYWEFDGSDWLLKAGENPISFAATFQAVPEPSSIVLLLIGGVAALAWRRRMAALSR